MTPYRVAPIYSIRPTGVAFDVLERLGTPAISTQARALAELAAAVARTGQDALQVLATGDGKPPAKLVAAIEQGAELAPKHLARYPHLEAYRAAVHELAVARAALDALIEREYPRIHDVLVRESARELPDFLLIESEAFAEDLARTKAEPAGAHTSKDRYQDRKLALYLQRVCAKNDSVSRFGPVAWGTVVDGDGVVMKPQAGVAARRVEIERWVVKSLLELVNADAETKPEALPRLHPHVQIGERWTRLDEDRELALSEAERAIAVRCDGVTPAHALDAAILAALVERGVITWQHELMAIDVSPLGSLVADVERWRATPVRDRWHARLARLVELCGELVADPSTESRKRIVTAVRAHLDEIGLAARANNPALYAARNAISENCHQAGTFTVGARTFDAMVAQALPWFELYRDATRLAGLRAYQRLHEVVLAAPRHGGVLRYSTLVRVAAARGLSVHNDHWSRLVGVETFDEIKRDFTALLARRADAPEWKLTEAECSFLRDRERLPPFEGAIPSADLQLAARSPEAAAAGDLRWVIAELHWPLTNVQHVLYWCCPDKPALHAAYAQIDPHPFPIGDAYGEAPVHASGESIMSALAKPIYIGSGRAKPHWRAVRPADAEVIVDEERCDIRIRAGGEDLGSIVRNVRLLAGMHPFFPFEREPHQPRLVVGDAIVQRRTWSVESSAIGDRPGGVSAAFVAGIERERGARGIPRWVFVRPAPGALGASEWFGRDKDNKPLCIDLESVVFLDIFERRLRKYGTMLVTEMVPDPDHLMWTLPDGRYTFELRTNLVPK